MNIDDLVKMLLGVSVSISLVLVAYGIYNLLKNLAEAIAEMKQSIGNVNELTDMTLNDYRAVRSKISSVYEGVEDGVQSFNLVKSLTDLFSGKRRRRR